MLQRREARGVAFYVSPLLERARVPHAFSTRVGGVSPPPFDSLNLGNPAGEAARDPEANVQANYRHLHDAAGCDGRRVWTHQVHGSAVARVGAADTFACGQPADALVTSDPAAVLAIRVADCVPVLIATGDGRTVAAAHAGWRGVVGGIVPAAVAALLDHRPDVAPTDLVAAIGPCIGPDAFEVGPEVVAAFRAAFGDAAPVRPVGHKGFVDLQRAVRAQLVHTGVAEDHVDGNDRCTVRDAGDFFSHRRDNGLTGRMAALVRPRGRGG